jgi:hypothetical protein
VLTLLLVILILGALGGFGHTGYRRGWYGGYNGPATGAWNGSLIGIALLVVLVLMLFMGGLFAPGPTMVR